MQFNRRNINKRLRNGDIISSSLYSSNSNGSGSSSGGILSGNYLPATKNETEVYIVPHYVTFQEHTTDTEGNEVIKNLLEITSDGIKVNGNVIASGEVSAFGIGSGSGETSGTTGTIDIEDNLTSNRTDAALSANMGRQLKEMIDEKEIDLSDYYNKTQIDNKFNNINIPEVDLSNYYNKSETVILLNNKLDANIWDDVFEIDSNGNLKVKVNLYGQGEISAYGSGSTDNTTEINLDNYYTKDEVNDLIDNIECTGGTGNVDLSEYSKTSHTHSNYALSNHSHSNYSPTSHTHTQYASSSHTHSISNITNLQSTLDEKSGTGHSHSNYATTTNFNSHSGNTTVHITSTERTNWNNAVTSSHTHNNKTVLDGITAAKVANWDDVYNDFNSVFTINSNGDLQVKVNVIGEGEISAYGSGSTDSSSGAITIVDNLTSTATTAALSANQGRILKGLIDSSGIALTNYYNKDEVDELIANADVDIDLSEYSKTSHTHSNYSLTSHTHSQYASSSHTHPISAITSLQSTLDGKSGTGHSHSNYSLTSHSHSNYSLTSHTHSQYASSSHTHNYAGSSSAGGAATSANKVNSTLTFTGGTFATKTFNGSSAVTVNVPTHTSHITNNSGYITTAATVANANYASSAGSATNATNATTASKLSTVSKTAWGQTYWTSGGIPTSISGNMTGVGSISASGNITTSAEVTAHSDIRLKSNIKPLENKGYVQPYRYIKDGKESIGFIAQEMQELYPQLVTVDESTEEKYLTVNYMQYTAVLQAQIIELSREIQELKDKLNDIYNKE